MARTQDEALTRNILDYVGEEFVRWLKQNENIDATYKIESEVKKDDMGRKRLIRVNLVIQRKEGIKGWISPTYYAHIGVNFPPEAMNGTMRPKGLLGGFYEPHKEIGMKFWVEAQNHFNYALPPF